MEKSKKILKVENLKKAYYSTSRTGEIITYKKLKAGTYKVYEIEGPEGYKVNKSPVTVEINSNSYKTMKDELGNEYLYAECEYYNYVTYCVWNKRPWRIPCPTCNAGNDGNNTAEDN